MRVTVLGGCGAWPAAGQACSGYLVEHDDFRLLLDPGYATTPRLLEHLADGEVDAVFISHGHPDHCADLNPLLRARALRDNPLPPLPVYTPPGAVDAVLALDRPETLTGAYLLHEFSIGAGLEVGPFRMETRLLPHWLPNAGLRLAAGGRVVAYTGDSGPSPLIPELARHADLLIAEASYAGSVPGDSQGYMSSAGDAGRQAADAGASHLVLTHLLPSTDRAAAQAAARTRYDGRLSVAVPGLVFGLG